MGARMPQSPLFSIILGVDDNAVNDVPHGLGIT